MPADMAAGAHQPLRLERSVEGRALGCLLGQRRVAVEACARVLRIGLDHLDDLAGHSGTHALGVQARLPVGELNRVAGPAARRRQRPLDGGKAPGRSALRWKGPAPVPIQEGALGRRHARSTLGLTEGRIVGGEQEQTQSQQDRGRTGPHNYQNTSLRRYIPRVTPRRNIPGPRRVTDA